MKEQQYQLFHESIEDALTTCVNAIGGPKKVGPMMWGDTVCPIEQGKKLTRCLNPEHASKLSLEEMMFILRKAHDVGCHAGINFICRDTGYADPQPVDIEDEVAQRERGFIQAVDSLQKLAGDIGDLKAKAEKMRAVG